VALLTARRRTYLTESLRRLLVGAVHRLTGDGGDPVIQLQTQLGGKKAFAQLAADDETATSKLNLGIEITLTLVFFPLLPSSC
jgi:hypothetical protein